MLSLSPATRIIVTFREACASVFLAGSIGGLSEGYPVIPRHPGVGLLRQFRGVSLQLGKIIERIGAAQLASMNQTPEQVTHLSPLHGLIK